MTTSNLFPGPNQCYSKEQIKQWLCELTHLNDEQVERLMMQLEQRTDEAA